MNPRSMLFAGLAAMSAAPVAHAGLIAYGICQTGCNTLAVACYASAGFTFGTVVASALAPPAILACNAALGTCSAACASVALLAPTP
ncbi:Zygote-specific protein [Abortiporus biennis]